MSSESTVLLESICQTPVVLSQHRLSMNLIVQIALVY
jgi:hypothetical protein